MNTFSRPMADSLKGVMQIGIVMSHLSYVVGAALPLLLIANKLGTSMIALYFFISGYGLMVSLLRSPQPRQIWQGFVPRRLWGLLKPLLVITLLALLIIPQTTLPSLESMIYGGKTPIPNAWFVFVLAWLYFSFWLSFRFIKSSNKQKGLLPLLLLSTVSMLYCYLMEYERAWWVTTLGFWAGSLYACYEETIYKWARRWWILALLLALVGVAIMSGIEEILPLTYIIIPIFIVTLLNIIGYAQWINSERPAQWIPQTLDRMARATLKFLQKISYELYLVHGLMINVLYELSSSPILYSLTVILSSITIAYLCHRMLKLLP